MELKDILSTCFQALIPILLSAVTYIGYVVKKKIDDTLDTKQKRDIVDSVVRFVEQTMKDYDSIDKKTTAINKATAWLTAKGINVSETELEVLIESAVHAINEGVQKADEEKQQTLKG